MPVSDQIGDFLTRIRNAGRAGHKTVDCPSSSIKVGIAEILKEQGYIEEFDIVTGSVQNTLRVTLKYYKRKPVIKTIKRVSKPGRRVYMPADQLPRVMNGLGIAVISTSKGIVTGKQAKQLNVGGEVICTVW